MSVKIPPLGSVRAFEAAARHLNFTRAAEELGMTQAAVSWQIKSLEHRLGVPLFVRRKQGLALTQIGAALAPNVTDTLAQLARTFENTQRPRDKLTISVAPTFAHSWLARHLGRFQAEYPDIQIEVDASTEVADLFNGPADIAVRRGKGNWPGLVSHRLLPVVLVPLCAPRLLSGYDRPLRLSDLSDLPMIQPLSLWRRWLAALDQSDVMAPRKVRASYPRQHMVIQAALAAQGIALLNPVFCADAIADGRLVHALPDRVVSEEEGYWLVYSPERPFTREIESFRSWIEQEMELHCRSIFRNIPG